MFGKRVKFVAIFKNGKQVFQERGQRLMCW